MTAGRAGPDAWAGSLRRWDVYSAVILAATLIFALITAGTLPARIGSAVALLAMVPWYVLIGRPAMTGDDDDAGPARWRLSRGSVYLAGLAVLTAAALAAAPASGLILLAACPQCFMAESFGRAVVAVAVFNFLPPAVDLARHLPAGDVASAAGSAVATLAFSIVFGTWVTRIIRQSRERAELIGELEATRAELAAAGREAGMLAERERMSAEIHDTIAQGFASIVMLLQAAEAALTTDPDGARHHLRLATQTARDNLGEARTLVAGLTPPQLDAATLGDALRRVAEQDAGQGGVAAGVEVTGPVRPLTTNAEVMLLRVCQEALSNVRKHARASRACVRLSYGSDQVRLEVSDDGAGFDPAVASGGFGLRGMRMRVSEAGGRLEVRSAPAGGTTVSVQVQA